MNIEIVTNELNIDIYGFSGVAVAKDYSGTAFRLMDKMWKVVKTGGLPSKGMNIWIYEPADKVFAGVELIEAPPVNTVLEHKKITLKKYAWYKHIGPYSLIKHAGENMRRELEGRGFTIGLPYIEFYGHWTNNEALLETELVMALDNDDYLSHPFKTNLPNAF